MNEFAIKQFHEQLKDAYDDQELRDLCFYLNVVYDDLRGEGRSDRLRALVQLMQRESRLHDLLRLCAHERPLTPWPTLEELTAPAAMEGSFDVRSLPQLLPYLVNRETQQKRLEESLQHFLQAQQKRPFVCLIFGDRYQSHHKFLERVLEKLPEKLGMTAAEQIAHKEYFIDWPERADRFHSQLQKDLAWEILEQPIAVDPTEINTSLTFHPGPVVIRSTVTFTNWTNTEASDLHQFMDFWQQWPPLGPSQKLFVFLFIKYTLEPVKGGFRLFRKQPAHELIRQALTAFDAQLYDRLHCTVLPELNDITEQQAEKWAWLEETKHVCRNRDLMADIHRIYDEWKQQHETGTIPMEKLADKLVRILEQYAATT